MPLIGGGEEELDVEAGTQSGTVLRLRGKGLPALDRSGRGDLHVTIRVATPRSLSAEQRHLLEKLANVFQPDGRTALYDAVAEGLDPVDARSL